MTLFECVYIVLAVELLLSTGSDTLPSAHAVRETNRAAPTTIAWRANDLHGDCVTTFIPLSSPKVPVYCGIQLIRFCGARQAFGIRLAHYLRLAGMVEAECVPEFMSENYFPLGRSI